MSPDNKSPDAVRHTQNRPEPRVARGEPQNSKPTENSER